MSSKAWGRRSGLRPGVTGALCDVAEALTRVLIGTVLVGRAHSDAAFARATTDPVGKRGTAPRRNRDGIPQLLPGAILGLGIASQRAIFDLVAETERRVGHACGFACRIGPIATVLDGTRGFLKTWDARFRAEAADDAELAARYLAIVGPGTLDELLTRIDVDAVLDHVDLNGAVGRLDLGALIDRVPMDRVVDAVDLRAVVLETVSQVQVTDIVRESTGAMAARLTGGRIRLR